MPSYFAAPDASVTVFEASSTDLLPMWPMVTRGKIEVDSSRQVAEMRCMPVTEENFLDFVIARLSNYNSKAAYFDRLWSSAAAQIIQAPKTEQLSEVGCQVSKLLQGSLTGSPRSGMFHVIGKGKYRYFSHHTVVVSDLSVVLIPGTDGRNRVTAWVTDATGADVANALVRLFSSPTSIYGATAADVSLVGKATTGADGVASVMIKWEGKGKLSRLVALVTHADTGGVAFDPQVAVPAPLLVSQWKVRLHTDRGLYKPGDNVHVKVVARVRLGSSRDKDGGRLVVPTPSAQSQFFLRVQWTSQGQPTYVPVSLSTAYGTAALNLTVPMDVDFGTLSLRLVRSLKPGHYESLPLGESILIADPRPPTVTMDLSLHAAADATTRTGLLVVPPGSKSAVDVRVLTKTQTGALVNNAEVAVTWKLLRGGATPKPADGAPFAPKLRCSVYGLDTALLDRPASYGGSTSSATTAAGEFTIKTGSDGVGRISFDLASALLKESQTPAQAGDSLEVTAQWIGPTREVVREKKSVPVADSPYAAGLSLSIDDPLPGINFGVRLDVRVIPDAVTDAGTRTASQTKLDDDKYTLSLYKWTQATAETFRTTMTPQDTSLQAYLLTFLSTAERSAQSVKHTCGELVNDNGATIQCDGKLQLPAIGQYLLVVQNTRTAAGERVAAALLLGRSVASWEAQPLSALASGLGVIADRPKYAEGDVATLTFVSPFAGTASMLVAWGNSVSGQASKQKKLRLDGPGKHSVAIDLGAECRGGCVVDTIVTAPAQASSIELPVPVPLSKLLRTKVSRTVLMRTKLAVADPDIPTDTPKVRVIFPKGNSSDFVLGPGETTDLQIDVDMKAFSGGKAELMVYVTDQAFLDLEPHALPGLARSFTLDTSANGVARKVADTSRYSASAVGLQSTIATFKRRFAADPWVCPDRFPLRPGQHAGQVYSGFSNKCQYLPHSAIPEVDETDASYFGRRKTDLTDFPSVAHGYQAGVVGFAAEAMDGFASGGSGGASVQRMGVAAQSAPQSAGRSASSQAQSTSTTSTAPRVELRTNAETTPLFVGSVKLNATGRAEVKFKAPGNIARFAVRAVVVGDTAAPGVFGETETHLIVRKPLSLLPSQPRIVRSRDAFSCGVTVTLQDANFDGTREDRFSLSKCR